MIRAFVDDLRLPLSKRAGFLLVVAACLAFLCVFFDYSDLFQRLIPLELDDGTIDWQDTIPLLTAFGAFFLVCLFAVATIPAPASRVSRDEFVADLIERRAKGAAAVIVVDLTSQTEDRELARLTGQIEDVFGAERVTMFRVR